jgi:ribosomal protein S18 acetylase RimI-like enzyme
MQIRPATPEDAEAIAAINVHTWQVAYAGIIPAPVLAGKQPTPPAPALRDWLALTDRVGIHTVAVDDAGTVLGYARYGPARPETGAPEEGEVYAIYVRPESWDTGAGRALMDRALADLTAEGRTVVRLWVLRDNDRARGFYQRCGFVADGLDRVERLTWGRDGVADVAEVRLTRVAGDRDDVSGAGEGRDQDQ